MAPPEADATPAKDQEEVIEPDNAVWEEDYDVEPMGVLDGSTYRLGYFYAWPPVGEVKDGEIEWNQTLGKVSLIYKLTEEQERVAETLKVELSSQHFNVFFGEKRNSKDAMAGIQGTFFEAIQRDSAAWKLLPGSAMEPPEEGSFLALKCIKRVGAAWPSLVKGRTTFSSRKTFHWRGPLNSAEERRRLEEEPRLVPSDPGIQKLNFPEGFTAHDLCIGYEETQQSDDCVIIYLHLDRSQLDLLEQEGPLEEFLSAEVEEGSVKFFVQNSAHSACLMEAHLQGRCIPEKTRWDFLRNHECKVAGMLGWNPVVAVELWKAEGHQHEWTPIFVNLKHLSERRLREAMQASGRDTQRGGSTPTVATRPRQGPELNREAVWNCFQELLLKGEKPKIAPGKAIETVRAAAVAGEKWALPPSVG
mmetsp:Transcript_53996/g.128640  ORF Transcript_53996/g.128640 Transcript_53996/m.128640 type:complete len:418 (-) Transcript_53996:32-1285(-)